jgi:predicted DCC family thiol-disulfide oxidoreductase YuxK
MSKPLLVYDGDCGFCKRWISYWEELTAGAVDYAPSQEVAHLYPEIRAEQWDHSVVLILPNREFFQGAHAVFLSLSYAPQFNFGKILLKSYVHIPGFALLCEFFYRFIARHRVFFSRLTYFLLRK